MRVLATRKKKSGQNYEIAKEEKGKQRILFQVFHTENYAGSGKQRECA